MATIQTGSGEVFKTTTAEGRLIETVCFLRLAELDGVKNPDGKNSVLGEFSISDLLFLGSYNLPCSQTLTTAGAVSIVANPYLLSTGFNPGSGTPTFKSAAIEAYLLEVLTYLQGLESNASKNPQGLNNVTGTYNADTGIYSGTFSIPVALTQDGSGKACFAAQEYLLRKNFSSCQAVRIRDCKIRIPDQCGRRRSNNFGAYRSYRGLPDRLGAWGKQP
jgi:hypothetical protein